MEKEPFFLKNHFMHCTNKTIRDYTVEFLQFLQLTKLSIAQAAWCHKITKFLIFKPSSFSGICFIFKGSNNNCYNSLRTDCFYTVSDFIVQFNVFTLILVLIDWCWYYLWYTYSYIRNIPYQVVISILLKIFIIIYLIVWHFIMQYVVYFLFIHYIIK